MKRFIQVLLVVGGLILAMPAQSQIKFGVKGGVHYSNTSFSSSIDSKTKPGFFVGPMAEIALPFMNLGVDGGLLYSQKTIKADDGSSKSIKEKDVILPINLRYSLGLGSSAAFYAFAGPQFAFNIDNDVNDNKRDYSFKTSTLSMNAGLGLRVNHIEISGNYNFPCGKAADYNAVSATEKMFNCKTKGWQFSLAYLF